MELPAPFTWQGEHVGIELPGGRALFTTRRGGVSEGPYASLNFGKGTDDDLQRVERNYELVAAAVGVPRRSLARGHQVHGTRVVRVCAPPAPEAERVESDGQATALRDVVPLVLTADCLPVALISGDAVAMVHAGWRGLADGVLEEGVAAVRELCCASHDHAPVAAAIGPGAGGCCYQVGDEVRGAFAGHEAAFGDDGLIDLKAIARAKLRHAGVHEVHDVGLCTMCGDPELFFSHRRDRGLTGRQAGLAWRS